MCKTFIDDCKVVGKSLFCFFTGKSGTVAAGSLLYDRNHKTYREKGGKIMETFDPDKKPKLKNVAGLLKKSGVAAVLVIAIPVIGFSSVYNIQEQEQAVLTTLGTAKTVAEPGLHFKIPFIQQVQKVNTTIQGVAIGYDPLDNQSEEADSLMITRDYNFVNVDFFVEYKVVDPVKAVYASEDPFTILQNISRSCIRTVIGSYDVDSVLTNGKNEIQSKVKEMVMNKLEDHDVGLSIVNVTIQDSEPPTVEVMEAFKAVETAKQGKETAINNANKYRNERLPEATAQTDKIMQEAESTRVQRVNEANAEVAKFNAMYEEYVKNPEVTRRRMFYEAMEDVLPGLKVIIDGTGKTETILPLDSFTGGAGSIGSQNVNTSDAAAAGGSQKPAETAPKSGDGQADSETEEAAESITHV